jgi:hypothetical protein
MDICLERNLAIDFSPQQRCNAPTETIKKKRIMNSEHKGMKDPIPLWAGPFRAMFTDGGLVSLETSGREALRRIYVAVRDRYWDTIEGELMGLEVDQSETGFTIRFSMRHRQNEIDFEWAGELTGDERGEIVFSMDGEARSTFLRNRIGFCVLHPIAGCIGQPCTVEHTDGQITSGSFPELISPHQPFQQMRAITHEVAPGARLTVRFEGDVFEMEDQRNWTDASYKTYCTPLALPLPVEIRRGEKIRQRIHLSLAGSLAPQPASEPVSTLTVLTGRINPPPLIGLGLGSHREPLGPREIERLKRLNLSHLRVELDLTENAWLEDLSRGMAEANAIGAELEVALFLSNNADAELSLLREALDATPAPIRRWFIFRHEEVVTSKHSIERARKHLTGATPTAQFGGGTNQYFTELNRNRPETELFDVISYSINPQVHAFDDQTLIENLEGQIETLTTARRILGEVPLAVTPVTLKPRFNPNKVKTSGGQAPTFNELPAAVDPRQSSLFAAAWTLGSLKYLSEGGSHSLTYYETTGWRGVMERESLSTDAEPSTSRGSVVFPLFHVLADVGEFTGGEVLTVETNDPLKVIGHALRRGQQTRLLLANLTSQPQAASVQGIEGARLMRRLHAETLEEAMTAPESFRARLLEAPPIQGGRMRLALLPYEVICIF